ncbi:CaiB/BaiF CoA transferase family protein [Wenxinia marina]|uniref:Putative acyl-CoA transferase/carnitine dehydratase n=1 Tax=Wenxinia marina DSM 24838 TaxID=1123501 RepID=A0A0D0NQC5_9RHOB|nr:CaiB/BaiF CoA-transferase family protein [Wenxinia marina]KIQ70480.1 putative acyl-CoA transferase/carnitine dehydratase [Wenxinia marina DSM 24838]GGL52787.1 CoA transferase [Wenxinia marina]
MTRTTGPLDGIRVLDLSRILAGPTCTQLLGDFGADVVKVEKPGAGDDTRAWGPPYVEGPDGPTSESAYYLSANRNKRSVALDIATPEGAAEVRRLAARADVLIENFKVGGLARYGLSWDDLKGDHPSLIYCSITGYGQTGPNAAKPGYDLMAQGYGGIMSLTGPEGGEPTKVGVAVADVMCGMYAASAILAALRHRDRTGEGQHIDIGLVDTQIAWLINQGTNYLTSGRVPQRHGNAHPNIVPYQVFEVSDGHVIVAAGNDAQFRRFAALIGAPGLSDDARFAANADRVRNRDALVPLLEGLLKGIARDDLLARMEAAGVPGGPIHDLADVFASDQVAAREMLVTMAHPLAATGEVRLIGNPVKFSATPVTYRHAPPTCGQQTEEVLRDWTEGNGGA